MKNNLRKSVMLVMIHILMLCNERISADNRPVLVCNLTIEIMIFEELIRTNKEAFIQKVEEVAAELDINPDHLMMTMYIETAKTFNPAITNKIGATGLIQFLPSTAQGLGTTTEALRQMSNVEQMDYVRKYLNRFKGRMNDFVDVYLAVFYPAAVGQPDSFRITSDSAAIHNPAFDINKDLDIEKGEIRKVLYSKIPKKHWDKF